MMGDACEVLIITGEVIVAGEHIGWRLAVRSTHVEFFITPEPIVTCPVFTARIHAVGMLEEAELVLLTVTVVFTGF